MLFLFRFIVAVAALVLAASAGFELLERQGVLATPATAPQSRTTGLLVGAAAGQNQLIANPRDFEVQSEYLRSEKDGEPPTERVVRAIIPVRADIKGVSPNWRDEFRPGSAFREPPVSQAPTYKNGYPVWACEGPTYSSLLVYDYASDETTDLVPAGVAVTSVVLNASYRAYETPAERLIFGTLVSEDANGDGVLNCNDPEKIFAANIATGEFTMIDVGGQPFFMTDASFQGRGRGEGPGLISIGVDENGDGVYDPFTEPLAPARLDLKTFAVTRISSDN